MKNKIISYEEEKKNTRKSKNKLNKKSNYTKWEKKEQKLQQ